MTENYNSSLNYNILVPLGIVEIKNKMFLPKSIKVFQVILFVQFNMIFKYTFKRDIYHFSKEIHVLNSIALILT